MRFVQEYFAENTRSYEQYEGVVGKFLFVEQARLSNSQGVRFSFDAISLSLVKRCPRAALRPSREWSNGMRDHSVLSHLTGTVPFSTSRTSIESLQTRQSGRLCSGKVQLLISFGAFEEAHASGRPAVLKFCLSGLQTTFTHVDRATAPEGEAIMFSYVIGYVHIL